MVAPMAPPPQRCRSGAYGGRPPPRHRYGHHRGSSQAVPAASLDRAGGGLADPGGSI